MLLIRHIKNSFFSELFDKGCVATIGNFDGLHLGHQAILENVKKISKNKQLPSVVITFESLPREYFCKKSLKKTPTRLTRFKEKWRYLEKWGIDVFVCLHFNDFLANLSAAQFVERVLLNTLNIKHLIVGHDFQFGYQREGDIAFLENQSKQHHFTLELAPVVSFEDKRISSTWVREALQENDLALAQKLLGRPYHLCGKIIHGDKQARQWGIPTANLSIHRSVIPTTLPVKGVYAVLVNGKGFQNLPGVANVGIRPTVAGFRNLLEVHLLNFDESIYDQMIEVSFLHKLRDEKRFDSLDLLKEQILKDVETARLYFQKTV